MTDAGEVLSYLAQLTPGSRGSLSRRQGPALLTTALKVSFSPAGSHWLSEAGKTDSSGSPGDLLCSCSQNLTRSWWTG